ncbi:hypothetical protein B4096_1900 [Heyndrickxia coagulans]|nr:hypothetical protein B4096_1900 [Heyndrickxia coagulans]
MLLLYQKYQKWISINKKILFSSAFSFEKQYRKSLLYLHLENIY